MRRFRPLLLVAVILLTGGALRVWYASAQLHINRFEDERYSLQNVRKIFHTGDLEPASGYYPSPVFNRPQAWALHASELLHRKTGDERFDAVGEKGRLLPTGFFLTRLYQTLCGTLTLLLVFLIGRRWMDERVGLLAALSLAFAPWMIHSSGYNKPDALLVMGVCLAFWTSLRAVESGRWLDHALAGAAIALAMSAKLTGGLIAVPLMAATLLFLASEQRWRRLALLATAGLTSALVFVVLNPYWKAYLHFIRGLQKDYAGRTEASPLAIPQRVAEMHLSPGMWGSWLGSAVLIAFLLLFAFWLHALVLGTDRSRRLSMTMFFSFPLAYMVAYGVQTSYFKANNFLPLMPFSALAFAWLLSELWQRSSQRLEARGGGSRARLTALGGLAAGLLAVILVLPGYRYTHGSVVPTTVDAARLWLHNSFDPAIARLVMREEWKAPKPPWDGTRRLHKGLSAEVEVADIDPDHVGPADALIFRLDRPGREGLEEKLMASGYGEILRSEPKWLALRGPPLLAVKRPWRFIDKGGATLSDCGGACFRATLPTELELALSKERGLGEQLLAFLWLPTSMVPANQPPKLVLDDGGELPLHIASRKGHGHLFVTPRFDVDQASELRFIADQDYGPGLGAAQVEIHRWRPGP